MLNQRKSLTFLDSVFGCSTLDGCAPLGEKGGASTLSPTKASAVVDYTVGEEVTCFHEDMEEWYHARVIGVNADATVDVEYMDGEVETNKTSGKIFRGALSMDQVRVGVEVRNGCRDVETSVTLPATKVTSNVLDFNLAGLYGKKSHCCVGLFVSKAHLSRHFSKFLGMSAVQMSESAEFFAVLEREDVTKLALVHLCSKVKSKDIVKKFFGHLDAEKEFATKLVESLPKTLPVGSTLSIAFMGKKGGVEVYFEQGGDKENSRSFSLSAEGSEELNGVMQVMKAMSGADEVNEFATMKVKLVARIPEMLR